MTVCCMEEYKEEKKSRKMHTFPLFILKSSFTLYISTLNETFRRSDSIFNVFFHLDGGQISTLFKNILSTFYKNIVFFSSNLIKSRLNDFFRLWRILNFRRRWKFSPIFSRLSPSRRFIKLSFFWNQNQKIYVLWYKKNIWIISKIVVINPTLHKT